MISKEKYDSLTDEEKCHVLDVFAEQLNVDVKKILDGKDIPSYRKLKRYCLNIIAKIEAKKGEK